MALGGRRETPESFVVHPFAIASLSSVSGFAGYLERVAPALRDIREPASGAKINGSL